jgi:hypothetical protein
MIRQLNHVRDRVIREVDRMLLSTHSFVSFLPETEVDVLTALQGDARALLLAEITGVMLAKFGECGTESRFSRKNRALRKGMPRGARKQQQPAMEPT